MADAKKDIDLKDRLGSYVPTIAAGQPAQAFIPPALPPLPPLDITALVAVLGEAQLALGKLDAMAQMLPDVDRFIYTYVRKEALVSSQIEGTQSSLSDLLLHEIQAVPGVPINDVEEVSNYVAAIRHGIQRVRDEDYPITLNLMRELHGMLLQGQRGKNKDPGEFRRAQVWLQDAYGRVSFVPPTAEHIVPLLGDMEKYINEEHPALPPIVRAALVHAQFETIHPFNDGNGRLGRLLIMLMLIESKVMHEPVLYLSVYFKLHRDAYYDALENIRKKGAWEEWVAFFLRGVVEVAGEAVNTAQRLMKLFKEDRDKILARAGRGHATALRAHDALQKQIYASVPNLEKGLNVSAPTARGALNDLLELGIVKEITGGQRNRVYVYDSALEILQEGASPITR